MNGQLMRRSGGEPSTRNFKMHTQGDSAAAIPIATTTTTRVLVRTVIPSLMPVVGD